ncbi:ABC transporter substrate-binding protein [Sulfitobacter sp. D35]|uniref:ABC transporter substrate-binding protein n=1 Tax=Sulfitobacter sp. D35 TaxID=3083252 RepID=UPI00296FDF4E|nr:ABC transporter substrate-binding protein [Sulfitobacter sp. D35]MDW4499701.1 ABC transporter substrate-binding protein [Sulfitobacter sp. D35]
MLDALRSCLVAALLCVGTAAAAQELSESTFWAQEVARGYLPPVAERLPEDALVVDLEAKGRSFGTQGGTLRTMVSRSKDVRQMVVYGYARLVGYDQDYALVPDILRDVEVEDERKFTFHLRRGHKWSDGHPFTSADFRYWWEHVAQNEELSPSGPPEFMIVDGELATMSFPDDVTVVIEWKGQNPNFLQLLAQAAPPFIYRPAHYLRKYHAEFADPDQLAEAVSKARVRSWAALHNGLDDLYKFDDPELPTLQPWMIGSAGTSSRQLFVRNPYFHRVDKRGMQLPYIDIVEMSIVGAGLVAAKTNAGESDLQARGLDFPDIAILKKGEADGGNYRVLLWANGAASQIAIYPNLNFADEVWREVMRDVRFRRALSLAIDRNMINRALYFGLANVGGMTALPESPLFDEQNLNAWTKYDPEMANLLLDDMGLTERNAAGFRLLPDGRPMEFVIETAGERQEVENALAIVTDTWRDIGVKLVMRPSDRDILRNRIYAGVTMAAVWFGWDNGLPQPYTSPDYLAPTDQVFFAWPMWGQYHQTGGEAGEAPDMPEAERLMQLASDWKHTGKAYEREAIWREMLKIHAENLFGIGILSGAPQPVVVNKRLRNVPENAVWAWDPGAHFGMYRIDEFYFDDPHQQLTQ